MDSASAARTVSALNVAPTGTVTLLFTDIVGSTTRWERNAAAMQEAVSRHDSIVRATIERHRGYVFKTVGDAFCVAFQWPVDAVRAAVELQSELGAANFAAVGGMRVRIAVHSGTTHERDGDYFGPAVNRVARLLSIGHGGQILASGITADLVRDGLPSGLHLADLGVHKLKDLERAEHVYQIDEAGREAVFPGLRTRTAAATNLPTTLTSFVGRDRQVADLVELLAGHRVVTIVGSGGIGKTRASAQVAALALERFPAGVWFVELAPLVDGALIPNTIAALVGIELAAGSDPVGSLVAALKAKELLLILDNCEHLIVAVAHIVAALVNGCPALSILATSRQTLGIAGEHPYRMPTLSVPPADGATTLTARGALAFEAIRLFVERAVAFDPRFELTDATAPVIAEICRRLDGIALAIELAAARVRVLAPAQLRDRLDKRLRLLTGSTRETVPRQQTLRALIDWSFDLLDEREQALFCRLGIFADGFTLEAATVSCAEALTDEFDMLELLGSLVDKSLVVADIDHESVRYRLLESMRAYALMKLDESGTRATVAARHLAYYAGLVEQSQYTSDQLRNDGHARAQDTESLAPELDNVRAALTWAFDGGDPASGAQLLAASRQLWRRWSASAEGIERCERAAANASAFDAATTARLLNVASFLAYKTGRTVAALEAAQRAVRAAHAAGDATIIFDALLCRALPLMFADRVDDAEADLRAAQSALTRELTRVEQMRLVEARGIVKSWREEYAPAAAAFAELAQLHEASGDIEGEVHAGSNLAECEHAFGQTERAIRVVQAALPKARSLGHYWYAFLLANLAGYLAAESDIAGARAAARSAIELSTTDPAAPLVANALEHFALTLAGDDPERAARLQGYCNATRAANGFRRQHTEQVTHERLSAMLAARYTAGELAALLAAGANLSASAAVEAALLAPESVT